MALRSQSYDFRIYNYNAHVVAIFSKWKKIFRFQNALGRFIHMLLVSVYIFTALVL
jgi:hypothetical protein